MSREISEPRKAAFYIGTGVAACGVLLFLSVFLTSAMNFGNFDDFQGRARSSMFRAFGGMILIVVGQIIRAVGARGMAGSGMVLDPDQARDDLRPYTNAAGGMIRDTIDSAGIDLDTASEPPPSQVILIRCPDCRTLNEEDHKFCSQCGSSLE